MNRETDVAALVERELDNLGFELVKLDIFSHGRKRVLRLYIDDPDTGVTIDDCVKVSKALGLLLDGEEAIAGPYNLEVSSPGINRPLSKPGHFRRFTGKTVRVEYSALDGVKASLIGEIEDADDDTVRVRGPKGAESIPYARIAKANLHGEKWEIEKKPPKGKRSGSKSR